MQFSNLQQGLAYREHCPHCERLLEMSWQSTMGDESFKQAEPNIYFKRVSAVSNVRIDALDNTCSWFPVIIQKNSAPQTGQLYFSLKTECIYCHYNFVINCRIDFSKMIIDEVRLNGESISILYKEKACGMRTIVTQDKLMYTIHDYNKNKYIQLEYPLMDIDFKNPEKTIKRLDKLKAFL